MEKKDIRVLALDLDGTLTNDQKVVTPATRAALDAAAAKGVTIVFNTYDIAPYSAGEQTFFIPYDLVKPYLNDYGLHLLELDT
jgi:phosphoglycolate phosphatase-like HAD superfamily hydrolase